MNDYRRKYYKKAKLTFVIAEMHYQLEPSFYGIFGLNYSYGSAETEVLYVSIAVEDYEIGANFGVGIISLPFFSELKYNTSFDQVSLSVGIYFTGD